LYVFTVGEEHINGFRHIYPNCHAPLDNVLLRQLEKYGSAPLRVPWSQLDYENYFACQQWIRNRFASHPPLDVEFWLWQEKNIPGFVAAVGRRT
jgi:hypothetical protein